MKEKNMLNKCILLWKKQDEKTFQNNDLSFKTFVLFYSLY